MNSDSTGRLGRKFPKFIWGEVRSRIVITYAGLFVMGSALLMPLKSHIFANAVTSRVKADLTEEVLEFKELIDSASIRDFSHFQSFIENTLPTLLPEDDTFLLILIDRKLYASIPKSLPNNFPDLKILIDSIESKKTNQLDDIQILKDGEVVFQAISLPLSENRIGYFAAVHLTAGEREELNQILQVEGLFNLGLLIIVLFLAWLISGFVLDPLVKLSDTAALIAKSADFSQRISIEVSGDLGRLANIFNRMMDRLEFIFHSQEKTLQTIEKQNQKLEAIRKFKDRFIGDITHDLRSPLSVMQMALHAVLAAPEHKRQKYVDIAQRAGYELGELIEDLLLTQQFEIGEYSPTLESFDVNVTIGALVEMTESRASNQQKTFSYHCSEPLPSVTTDRRCLERCLRELLNNAVKYTEPEGKICLDANLAPGWVVITVANTGQISSSDQSKVFDRFYRVPRPGQPRVNGTGMGLAILKQMADQLHWHLALTCREGWVRFTLSIPLQPGLNVRLD